MRTVSCSLYSSIWALILVMSLLRSSFSWLFYFWTDFVFLNKPSFSVSLRRRAISLPVTELVFLSRTAETTFSTVSLSRSRFVDWITALSWLALMSLSYSMIMLSCLSVFSSCRSSSFDSWGCIACWTCSLIALHAMVLWPVCLPFAKRHSVLQAKAGRVQLYSQQKRVALLLVAEQTGFPYEIIRNNNILFYQLIRREKGFNRTNGWL